MIAGPAEIAVVNRPDLELLARMSPSPGAVVVTSGPLDRQPSGAGDLYLPSLRVRTATDRRCAGGSAARRADRRVTASELWYALAALAGSSVRLEPLTLEHADGYLAAAGTGEDAAQVFQWLTPPGSALMAPVTIDEARGHILTALAARARGQRLPYAQLDAISGAFIGTTSFYEIDPVARSIAIGHTWLGRSYWGAGHNIEAKLLLLTFAFDELGAVRVVWHTDIKNERSQAAIERLGAQREGVMRKHRLRRDGSWRDTVQFAMTDDDWVTARPALEARLAAVRE